MIDPVEADGSSANRAYGDIEDAPRTALSHTGRHLNGYRISGVIYATDLKEAQRQLELADLYLDHARIVKWDQGDDRLRWESAGHEQEPGDQVADQGVFDHGRWELGPDDRGWTVTLVHQDENLDIVREWTWRGRTEQRVKDVADYVEGGIRRLREISGESRLTRLMIADWLSETRWLAG